VVDLDEVEEEGAQEAVAEVAVDLEVPTQFK